MNLKTKKQQIIYATGIGITVSVMIMILLFLAIDVVKNRDDQRQRLEVLEKFLSFQSRVEATINESTNLLEGYLAYIKTNPDISEDETNRYLEQLLSKKTTLIRNIGMLENTTVIWNYPREGNEKVIGVDLAKIPDQREGVLKVKETLKRLFVGPINLVQGDVGFIARIPVIIEDEYCGQISIVLDADRYLENMDTIMKELHIHAAIYNQRDFPQKPFYGDSSIIDREGLTLDVEILNNQWKVVVEPLHGWQKGDNKIITFRVVAILVSLIIGFFIYMIFHTRYQLHDQAMNDQLTGLNNRYVLEYYYQMVLKKAEANNGLIGIFLIDINRFKAINDNYGHKVGDLVLIAFAKRLNAIAIQEKRVFRLGGDEFLILVSDIHHMKDLEDIEERLRAKAVFNFKHEDMDIPVIPSIGLATYPIDGDTLEKVMNIADTRMYEEKRMTKENGSINS
ncbi:sensor domain-containing diguanylate cyclase [Vallitalea pronyensis]|uniref:Sensor domain-containing diguanylate cyclase n=1 Tax=Vallitalea pronyensis TaxID=1348613 RepID=A0A8J8MND3_9FIRM|nr:diguanylate cyclase [Vallitalea pronyensis]QUI24736.1 sensor domain-containing diguanylate cyclase [Vallitalea pronyensis]